MKPKMIKPKEIVEKGYDSIFERYHQNRALWQNQKELQELIEHLPVKSTILDAGCGGGIPVTQFLTNKGHDVIGIDLSTNMIKLAQRNVPEAVFYKMDMTQLWFPKESFDAITCFYAIIHVPRKHHVTILSTFYTLLKPKGWLLLSVGLTDSEAFLNDDWFGASMYWSHYDKETSLALLQKTGFKILWTRSVGPPNDVHSFVLAQKT